MKRSKNKVRCVSAKELRSMMLEMAETICEGKDKVMILCSGNTFHIHLNEDASLNITVNEKGGKE